MHQHRPDGRGLEHQLQVMDVYIVDLLAQIEALLRHAHSMQRVRECGLLRQIVQDLQAGIDAVESTERPEAAQSGH